MAAGKEGSLLNAMLADAAVAISVALQSGVPAAALAKSVGRLPADWRALWLVPGGGRPQLKRGGLAMTPESAADLRHYSSPFD